MVGWAVFLGAIDNQGGVQQLRLLDFLELFVGLHDLVNLTGHLVLNEDDLLSLDVLASVVHLLRVVLQTGQFEQLDDVLVLP